MTTLAEEIRRTVLENPGKDADAIMELAKGVGTAGQCRAFLKFLIDDGKISRAKIGGRFCYWPPGKAPADEMPGVNIDKIHKRGVNRAEQATSQDQSAGRGHTDGGGAAANPQPAPGSEARSPGVLSQGGPQPPLPIPRGPAEAMKAGGRASAGPSLGETQSGRPAKIITPDWTIYPLGDELLIMHKDTATGFRLDAETVAAIRGIQW